MPGENYDAHVEKEWPRKQTVLLNIVILADFKTPNILCIL